MDKLNTLRLLRTGNFYNFIKFIRQDETSGEIEELIEDSINVLSQRVDYFVKHLKLMFPYIHQTRTMTHKDFLNEIERCGYYWTTLSKRE